jgi:hypothetical protein
VERRVVLGVHGVQRDPQQRRLTTAKLAKAASSSAGSNPASH